jgi:hypothetical protein
MWKKKMEASKTKEGMPKSLEQNPYSKANSLAKSSRVHMHHTCWSIMAKTICLDVCQIFNIYGWEYKE